MLDAISTLNTRVDAVPSQIKTNNRQMLATIEQNAEASSRAYATGQYLAVNGKLYKALNNITQGDALQENVNIEWVLLGDEVSKLRGDLKAGAYSEVVNDWNRQVAGGVLDARLGSAIKEKMNLADTLNTRVGALESHYIIATSSINTVVDAILALPDGRSAFALVLLTDNASKYLTGVNTPCYGIGSRADRYTVDLFFGAYSLSSVYICRIVRSNNNYTISGLKRVVLQNVI